MGDNEYLRTIKQFKKVYDVSSVDMPANPNTVIDIAARSAFEGFIENEKQEMQRAQEREKQKRRIKLLTEV